MKVTLVSPQQGAFNVGEMSPGDSMQISDKVGPVLQVSLGEDELRIEVLRTYGIRPDGTDQVFTIGEAQRT
jgi:hypothetical protein